MNYSELLDTRIFPWLDHGICDNQALCTISEEYGHISIDITMGFIVLSTLDVLLGVHEFRRSFSAPKGFISDYRQEPAFGARKSLTTQMLALQNQLRELKSIRDFQLQMLAACPPPFLPLRSGSSTFQWLIS